MDGFALGFAEPTKRRRKRGRLGLVETKQKRGAPAQTRAQKHNAQHFVFTRPVTKREIIRTSYADGYEHRLAHPKQRRSSPRLAKILTDSVDRTNLATMSQRNLWFEGWWEGWGDAHEGDPPRR